VLWEERPHWREEVLHSLLPVAWMVPHVCLLGFRFLVFLPAWTGWAFPHPTTTRFSCSPGGWEVFTHTGRWREEALKERRRRRRGGRHTATRFTTSLEAVPAEMPWRRVCIVAEEEEEAGGVCV